jgi:hypothetical protein
VVRLWTILCDTPSRDWREAHRARTVHPVEIIVVLLAWLGLSLVTAALVAAVCRGGHADG